MDGAAASSPPVRRVPSRSWSELSRAGRAALRAQRFRRAETHFVDALEALDTASPRDARAQSTLGNLVRLAAIYERVDRKGDADRVMSVVTEYSESRALSPSSALRRQADYRALVEQPLGPAFRPRLESELSSLPNLDSLIAATARRYRVDPLLVRAVVKAESNFDAKSVSEAGALGLMQLMPETAREMGVQQPFKPSDNLKGGVRYLRKMLDRYGEVSRALAAYNAGPSAVDQYGGIPPYPETEAYVERVLSLYRDYGGQIPQ